MTRRKPKRALSDWPAVPLGPLLMRSGTTDREAILAWGPDRIAQYTRATRDSSLLTQHFKLHQPTTPLMDALLADILTGKVKVMPRRRKKWLAPDVLAAFRHWHEVIHDHIENGEPNLSSTLKAMGLHLDLKRERTKAAWFYTGVMYSISAREAKKLYGSETTT